MFAKEEGVPVEKTALEARIRSATAEVAQRQAASGIDIINDGEMGKPSYATYVKDRLNGFGGASVAVTGYQDLIHFPDLAKKVFGDAGRARRKTPGCDGPIRVRDPQAAVRDTESLKAALQGVKSEDGFLSAASPGVVSLFFGNLYYPDHRSYLFAIADAMREEYEAIAKAGFIVQADCPDLAMGRHIQFADLTVPEFRKMAQLHIEALNHAMANVPPEQSRIHLCWGNYEGPHHTQGRIITMSPCATSSKSCSKRGRARFRLRPRIRGTRTNGPFSNTLSFRQGRCSSLELSNRRRITSSIRNW